MRKTQTAGSRKPGPGGSRNAADSLTRQARGWKIEHVFDVSQTDGALCLMLSPSGVPARGVEGFRDGMAAQVKANGLVPLQEKRTHPDALAEMNRAATTVWGQTRRFSGPGMEEPLHMS